MFCPQCIYMFCVHLRTNSDYFFLYVINLPVFITEAESVYSAVRTGSLNQTDTVSSLKESFRKYAYHCFVFYNVPPRPQCHHMFL